MTGKVRVLHVVYGLYVGGVEQFLLTLLRHWGRDRYELEICCLIERGDFAPAFEQAGIPVTTFDYDRRKRIASMLRLRDFLKQRAPHVVHLWCYGLHPLAAVAARMAGVKVVVTS